MVTTTGVAEWASHSVNCVLGCSHRCRYCYGCSMALERFGGLIKSSAEWGTTYLRVREGEINRKRRKLPGQVMFPTTHDIEPRFLEPCLTVLGKLLRAGNEVLVVSKPHLECVKRICSEFAEFKREMCLRFTIGAYDDGILSYWEPGAPGFAERLECLKLAYGAGYRVGVSMEPLLDSANVVELVGRVLPWVSDTVWIGKMNKIGRRLRGEVDEGELRRIEEGQTDERVWEIYRALKGEPRIRWKDSYREVLGLT